MLLVQLLEERLPEEQFYCPGCATGGTLGGLGLAWDSNLESLNECSTLFGESK